MKKIKYILLISSLFININIVKAETNSEIEASLNNMNSSIFLSGHPVGSIYETTASDENTAAKMASKYGGTWEAYGENKVLRGATGSLGQGGGSETVTLTTDNLPEHTHSIPALSGTAANTGSGYTITYNTTSTNNDTTGNQSANHTHSYERSNDNTNSTKLTINQIPSHSHKMSAFSSGNEAGGYGLSGLNGFVNRVMVSGSTNSGSPTSDTGGGQGHSHSIGRTTVNTGGQSANHNHKYTNKYATGISGVAQHSHTVTTTASTTGKAGKASPNSFSVLDPYITVYRYKRTK